MVNQTDKKRDKLITLPIDVYEIKHTLPMANCRICGYDGCLWLAMQIREDHSAVDKCPYMQSKLYWLEPRSDCHDCGYDTCFDFKKAVNKNEASVFDCPYTYGEDKTSSCMTPKSGKTKPKMPPRSDNSSDIVRYKERLITLPVDAYDIEHTLPMTNCKVCGYDGCLWLAMQIGSDHSAVDKCPFMQSKLYWLEPRSDCHDCGYDTCFNFTKAVNEDKASVFDCPYAYGENKTKSNMPPKSANSSDSVCYKERLITLPVDLYDIRHTLPMTDCKDCGYYGCIWLARKIERDHSAVHKCPYIQSKLYWLDPRNDCHDCGYDTCLDFAEAVNEDKASVFDCPYAYGEDKPENKRAEKTDTQQ